MTDIPNSKMTKEQKKEFDKSQSFMKMAHKVTKKEKLEFSEEICCQVCDKILGYGREAWIEALCEGCSLV